MSSLVLASGKGLFEEIWESLVDRYFSLDMPYFENFNIRGNTVNMLRMLIIGLSIGIIFTAFSTLFNKRHLGDFVRKLMYEECFDAKSAKTLAELGYLKDPAVRGVIKTGGTLSRWVRCVEEDEFLAEMEIKRAEFNELHKNEKKPPKFKEVEFKRDCNTMHFYLPEDKKYAADVKFDSAGANAVSVMFVIIGAIAFCLFMCYMLPDVLKLIDNFITIMNGNK